MLTTSFPLELALATAPVVVRVALNQLYTATLLGTDADPHLLTLSAAGEGFNLADMGIRQLVGARSCSGRPPFWLFPT